jgi:Na+/melibiose symporter-like transporter
MLTVMLAYMFSDTFQALVTVPFFALTPEITPDYDERTSLTGCRCFFNPPASLVTAGAAPMVVDEAPKAGLTQQQGYKTAAGLFGGFAAVPFLLIFVVVRERLAQQAQARQPVAIRETVRTVWSNIPFRFATAIYMLKWITFDLVALMLPWAIGCLAVRIPPAERGFAQCRGRTRPGNARGRGIHPWPLKLPSGNAVAAVSTVTLNLL